MTFDAVIVASGEGRRFSSDIPKQFLEFGSKTVIQTTIDTFLSCEGLRCLVVVLPSSRMDEFTHLFDEYRNTGNVLLVAGGKTALSYARRIAKKQSRTQISRQSGRKNIRLSTK